MMTFLVLLYSATPQHYLSFIHFLFTPTLTSIHYLLVYRNEKEWATAVYYLTVHAKYTSVVCVDQKRMLEVLHATL